MATVNIDSKLLEALQQSTCFGIAHDETVPECKQCDVKGQCKAKSEGLAVPTPTTKPKKATPEPKAEPKKTAPAKKSTPAKTTKTTAPKSTPKPSAKKTAPAPSGNMPDFKPMELDELKALAADRSVEWKDYGNDQITRMRLIMGNKYRQ